MLFYKFVLISLTRKVFFYIFIPNSKQVFKLRREFEPVAVKKFQKELIIKWKYNILMMIYFFTLNTFLTILQKKSIWIIFDPLETSCIQHNIKDGHKDVRLFSYHVYNHIYDPLTISWQFMLNLIFYVYW